MKEVRIVVKEVDIDGHAVHTQRTRYFRLVGRDFTEIVQKIEDEITRIKS